MIRHTHWLTLQITNAQEKSLNTCGWDCNLDRAEIQSLCYNLLLSVYMSVLLMPIILNKVINRAAAKTTRIWHMVIIFFQPLRFHVRAYVITALQKRLVGWIIIKVIVEIAFILLKYPIKNYQLCSAYYIKIYIFSS